MSDATDTKVFDSSSHQESKQPSEDKLDEPINLESQTVHKLQQSHQVQSVHNHSFVNAMVEHIKPHDWTGMNYTPYSLINIYRSTIEYHRVEALFKNSVRSYVVTKIERIENPFLFAKYTMKMQKLVVANEMTLFHGTNEAYLDGICRHNFDWRLCGTSMGHKFGRGVSFARDAFYATHYTMDNVMVLAKVLVKYKHLGDKFTTIPIQSFDTTSNQPETVIVKYEDDDFYPSYIIHYDIKASDYSD